MNHSLRYGKIGDSAESNEDSRFNDREFFECAFFVEESSVDTGNNDELGDWDAAVEGDGKEELLYEVEVGEE